MSEIYEETNITISPFYIYKWSNIIDEIKKDTVYNYDDLISIFFILDNYFYSLLGCNSKDNEIICEEKSPLSYVFNYSGLIIQNLRKPISNVKSQISNPVKDFFDNFENSVISIFSIVIIIVILYCIIIEFLLSVFCCVKKFKFIAYLLKWIFCFIYYTSIFVVIIGFMVGIIIGFFGCVVKDLANVVEFITSTENLNDENPKIFGNKQYTKYLDVCLNGDGNLAQKLGLTDNFNKIDSIIDIKNSSEEILNNTHNETSYIINKYINLFETLNESYLNIEYYDIEKDLKFDFSDRIKEINNYVSGKYSNNCWINENWNTKEEEEGYIYDESYPKPDINNHYLIYLYDQIVYDNEILETRYDENTCDTFGHPYPNINEASKKFGKLFKDIRDNIFSNNFKDDIIDDLNELNKLYNEKNKYLQNCLNSIIYEIKKIGNTYLNLISYGDNIFLF